MNYAKKNIKVSVSVTDFPIFRRLDYIFNGLKDAGADGVEITPGIKTRWSFNKLIELSDKHNLPITSIHQPPWSVAGFWFDEGFLTKAQRMGINTFVFHPPSRYSFDDDQMKQFLHRLADLQQSHGVNILVENMPWAVRPPLFRKYLPYHQDTIDPKSLAKAVKQFGLGMTLDTSHVFITDPQNQEWFDEVYPLIKNVHLSSFKDNRDHLPLDMGDFNTRGFVAELKRRQYKGLITLEICYPKKLSLRGIDFEAIKRSIDLVHNI